MARYNRNEPHKRHEVWRMHGCLLEDGKGLYNGAITAQADAGDFDADNRTDALVEALSDTKKVIIRPPKGMIGIEIRFRANGTAGDQHILPVFAAAGVDHYVLVKTLTIEQGAQIYSGIIYFIDHVVGTGGAWITLISDLTTDTNNIGRFVMNTHGYDRFWLVASTLDTTGGSPSLGSLFIDWKPI